MKKVLSIFVVILLYLFVFIFSEDKTEYKVKINLPKEKIEVKIQKKAKKFNTTKNQQNKAFLYPSVFEKGNIVLYPNNPNEFPYPSFEPKAKACRVLINKINNAKKSIDFAVYGIDSQDELILALNNAKKRGVIVRGVSDSNEFGEVTYKDILKLKNIPITLDNSRYIMHNKFFIIDDTYLLTAFFGLFIFISIFNSFNARTHRLNLFSSIYKNKVFIIVILFIAFVQIYLIYYGGDIFRTRGLTLNEFIFMIICASTVIPFDFMRKIYLKSKNKNYGV